MIFKAVSDFVQKKKSIMGYEQYKSDDTFSLEIYILFHNLIMNSIVIITSDTVYFMKFIHREAIID